MTVEIGDKIAEALANVEPMLAPLRDYRDKAVAEGCSPELADRMAGDLHQMLVGKMFS